MPDGVSRHWTVRPSSTGHITLFGGLFAVSTSGPFFIMAHIDAFAAVLLRTALAGALGLMIAAARGKLNGRALRLHGPRVLLTGMLLGGHFLLWVKAFELTDYASNLLLLVAQPITAAMVGTLLGEPVPRRGYAALALALVGMFMIAGGDISLGARALLGDALCITSGVLIALYYAVGRRARNALPLESFIGTTMFAAAVVALPAVLVAHVPVTGFSPRTWAWLAAIVVLTTLGGHSLMNVAAKHVSLFSLNLVIVLEPAIAIAMGAVLFGATVTRLQCAAGVVLGTAVVIGLRPVRPPVGRAEPISVRADFG